MHSLKTLLFHDSLLFCQRTSLTLKRSVLNCRWFFFFSLLRSIIFSKEIYLLLSCFSLFLFTFSTIGKKNRRMSAPSCFRWTKPIFAIPLKNCLQQSTYLAVLECKCSRLKTFGPSALFIPLRANVHNYKSKCAVGNHVNTNKGFLVAKLISCK